MLEFTGIYSDGKSATAHDVHVRLTENTIQFSQINSTTADNHFFEEWSYKSLTSSQPVHADAPTQLGYKENPGATLFINDKNFAQEIAKRASHLSKKAERHRIIYPTLAISFLICCSIAYIYIADIDVFQKIARFIPEQTRQTFGQTVINGQIAGKKVCTNTEGLKSLQKIQNRLQQASGVKQKFDIRVAKLGLANAFAAPGKNMLITGELIEQAESPEEIAGVMAHEMGHGVNLHAEAGFLRVMGLSITISLITGGDASWLTDLSFNLVEMKNRRSAEHEADIYALKVLRSAQISPKPMLAFYQKVMEKHGKDKIDENIKSIRQLFSTHPSTPERIKLVKSQPDWPTSPLLTDSEWKALKSICK